MPRSEVVVASVPSVFRLDQAYKEKERELVVTQHLSGSGGELPLLTLPPFTCADPEPGLEPEYSHEQPP